jgi:hypothetical protein
VAGTAVAPEGGAACKRVMGSAIAAGPPIRMRRMDAVNTRTDFSPDCACAYKRGTIDEPGGAWRMDHARGGTPTLHQLTAG